MRPLPAYKATLTELYIYKETYEKVDERFQSIYIKAVSFAWGFDTQEKEPNVRG